MKEENILRCPHPNNISASIRFCDEHVLLLCTYCFEDLENSFVTGFIERSIKSGIREGLLKSATLPSKFNPNA